MANLMQLWLPILATAIGVFVASSLVHMVFKWHNSDYRKLSNEDAVRDAIRAGTPKPGQYVLPHCKDHGNLKDEAMLAKFRDGPVGHLTILRNGQPAMGPMLGKWFVLNLAVAAIAACLALQVLGLNADHHAAGHLVGMVSFLTYFGGSVQAGIWMGKPWGTVAKDLLDSLIYGTISALAFMFLWP
jgi:UDP-N-acetylmuramyl tripeptide synthase